MSSANSNQQSIRRLDAAAADFEDAFSALLTRGDEAGDRVTAAVMDIIRRVRRDGMRR